MYQVEYLVRMDCFLNRSKYGMAMGRNAENNIQPLVVIIQDGWNIITMFAINVSVLRRSVRYFKYHRCKKIKVSSYIAQYPVLRIAKSALHFTSLADLFNKTPSQLL